MREIRYDHRPSLQESGERPAVSQFWHMSEDSYHILCLVSTDCVDVLFGGSVFSSMLLSYCSMGNQTLPMLSLPQVLGSLSQLFPSPLQELAPSLLFTSSCSYSAYNHGQLLVLGAGCSVCSVSHWLAGACCFKFHRYIRCLLFSILFL